MLKGVILSMALSYLLILAICVIIGAAGLILAEPASGKRFPDGLYVIAAIVIMILIAVVIFTL